NYGDEDLRVQAVRKPLHEASRPGLVRPRSSSVIGRAVFFNASVSQSRRLLDAKPRDLNRGGGVNRGPCRVRGRKSSSPSGWLKARWVRDYRALEVRRRRANRLVLTVAK